MARWKNVETYLADQNEGEEFTVDDYAAVEGIETAKATDDIQRYLKMQRRPNSRTMFILHRVPGTRTSNAKWRAGARTRDAMQIGDALFSDIRVKIMGPFQSDLKRLATLNPRAAKRVERQLENMVTNMIPILKNAVMGEVDDGEDG